MLEINTKCKPKKVKIFQTIANLYKDKFYIVVLVIIFLKSILFTGTLGTKKAVSINMRTGFFSAPPYILYFMFSMLILSVSFIFKKRLHLFALIIIDFLFSMLFLGDIWYYRQSSGFLNFYILFQSKKLNFSWNDILKSVRPIDAIFIIDIIFLIIYAVLNKNLYSGVKRSMVLFLLTAIIPIVYISYDHYKVDIEKRCFYGQTVFVRNWAPTQTMSNLGPIGYHIFDGFMYNKYSKAYTLSESDKNDIKTWYEKNVENLPDNKYAGMFKGKNLLVIQVESLENFVINQKINGQEITPNLNKLLKNSLYFDNYRENVYNGTSSDSDLLTNTGLYPVRLDSTAFRYPGNTYKFSLPNVLKSSGYSTFAVHPDFGACWNWMLYSESMGFEKCFDSTNFESKNPIGLGLSDEDLMDQTVPIMENQKNPFYLFMVTQSSHGPFDLPKQYRELKIDPNLDSTIIGDYFQSVHYTDEAIGNFINKLDKDGVLKNTMVVIYGDHTGVHKFYPDKAAAVKPAQSWWLNNDMRIPLIVYNPLVKGETFNIQCGQIDVMPTIEYLLGMDKTKYENQAMGKVLVNTNKKYTILENLQMYGEFTPDDEKHAKDGIMLSDKIISSDYFREN